MLPNRSEKVEFGKAVRAERQRQGLTQIELGKKLGIDKGSVGSIERANVTAKPETAANIERALFGDTERDNRSEPKPIGVVLSDASIEEILEELKVRGFKNVSLSYS